MPRVSKDEVRADRAAAARRQEAESNLDSTVHAAFDAGVTGAEVAKIVSSILRQRGLTASAAQVITALIPRSRR
jgi:hypothetical protein